MIVCKSNGESNIYRFIFDYANKTCETAFVTKCPNSGEFVANGTNLFIFTQTGRTVHVYDFQENVWHKNVLHNAPENGIVQYV